MERPRILLDVDGPIADFVVPALDAIFTVTGRRFSASDHVNGWDIFSGLGLSDEETKEVFRVMQVPGLCLGIPMVPGAREGIEELRRFADVWAVTSPFGGAHWMHERDAWLVRNMGFHKSHVLHVRGEVKHGVYGNMLVEDKVDTLRSWQAAWSGSEAVLFELPYNVNAGWTGHSIPDWPNLVAYAMGYCETLTRLMAQGLRPVPRLHKTK
jgi:5'(3')-deoxyribonucleotidase